jgi:adenylosuccinate synthase
MPVDILLGLQWGDEGKGKIVDVLSRDYAVVARFQGGPNAGHTIHVNGQKFILHHVPSGILHPHTTCIIGNGAIIDPITLQRELTDLQRAGISYADRLIISDKAHLVLPTHSLLDKASELKLGDQKIGSTLRGISPCYTDKVARVGIPIGEMLQPQFQNRFNALIQQHLNRLSIPKPSEELEKIIDHYLIALQQIAQLPIGATERYLHHLLSKGERILAEGAQGSLLDLEFGSYPYVTSSQTTSGAVCTGLGISPKSIDRIIGITKAYATRVGNGPFPTEQDNETGEFLRQKGQEFGSTTGRPRRCGWLDLPALQYAIAINGVTELIVTKLDVLDGLDQLQVGTHYQATSSTASKNHPSLTRWSWQDAIPIYESVPCWDTLFVEQQLHPNAKQYLSLIQQACETPIRFISNGPNREDFITVHL